MARRVHPVRQARLGGQRVGQTGECYRKSRTGEVSQRDIWAGAGQETQTDLVGENGLAGRAEKNGSSATH